ncbi:MAG TPA: hypothetical protein VMV33_17080 [Rhodocyclaceae bacterium]|nr:hypothetical protein [Rhodocyclaceae bacterium]
MPWAVASSAISAGGNILGGILGGNSADKAAQQAAAKRQEAVDFSKQVYGETQGNLQPYIGTGQDALSSLAGFYGLPGGNAGGASAAYDAYTQTQPYQFQYGQGLLAANRGLAASGLTGSGAQAKGLTQYGQGYASTNFDSYLSRLGTLAGLGQSSAMGLGQIGTNTSGQVGGFLTGVGDAQAAGTVGSNKSLTGALSGVGGAIGDTLSNKGVQGFLSGLSGSSFGFGGNAP